eukprot:17313-Heterococcus_DN1.PRE.3
MSALLLRDVVHNCIASRAQMYIHTNAIGCNCIDNSGSAAGSWPCVQLACLLVPVCHAAAQQGRAKDLTAKGCKPALNSAVWHHHDHRWHNSHNQRHVLKCAAATAQSFVDTFYKAAIEQTQLLRDSSTTHPEHSCAICTHQLHLIAQTYTIAHHYLALVVIRNVSVLPRSYALLLWCCSGCRNVRKLGSFKHNSGSNAVAQHKRTQISQLALGQGSQSSVLLTARQALNTCFAAALRVVATAEAQN